MNKLKRRGRSNSGLTVDAIFKKNVRNRIRVKGKATNKKNIVGILVDRRLGNISFFLNGRSSQMHPIAFENLELVRTANNLYIAVSMTRGEKT